MEQLQKTLASPLVPVVGNCWNDGKAAEEAARFPMQVVLGERCLGESVQAHFVDVAEELPGKNVSAQYVSGLVSLLQLLHMPEGWGVGQVRLSSVERKSVLPPCSKCMVEAQPD
jgi:hypothetical protein